MKPHKHAEVIKAWADGAEIQIKDFGRWFRVDDPTWNENREYRIKPAEKVVRWLWTWLQDGTWCVSHSYMSEQEAEAVFVKRAKNNYIRKKLEWSREEFDK